MYYIFPYYTNVLQNFEHGWNCVLELYGSYSLMKIKMFSLSLKRSNIDKPSSLLCLKALSDLSINKKVFCTYTPKMLFIILIIFFKKMTNDSHEIYIINYYCLKYWLFLIKVFDVEMSIVLFCLYSFIKFVTEYY